MGYVTETALDGDIADGLIGLHEELHGVVEAILYDGFHKGFAGEPLEVFAEGVGCEVGYFGDSR